MRISGNTGIGVIAAAVTPVAVAFAAFATGSQIFSPGPLNGEGSGQTLNGAESHAELQCSECHAPFWGDERMADRCVACHTDIPPEFNQVTTLHGSFEDPLACRNCHPDHGGLDADLTVFEPENYPHAEFGFYLLAHLSRRDGSAFECRDCHVDSLRTFDEFTCAECHLEIEDYQMLQHVVDLSFNCLACHDGIDTFGSDFDHQSTEYPLTGQHLNTSCGGCHLGATSIEEMQSAPSDCVACHSQDDTHEGQFAEDCAACHSTETWQEATVDHDRTAFPLVGQHQEAECLACHVDAQWSGIPSDCAGCHTDDDVHKGKLGTDCVACHSAQSWKDVRTDGFDHDLTGYPLTGKHVDIPACESCHGGGQFVDTPTQCVACHREDDAHNTQYGTDCETCHRTSGWKDASFDHNRTSFRLTGAHESVRCESCHTNGEYAGTPASCVACHAPDDVHAGSFGTDCAACHSTTTWRGAAFDHQVTGFFLTGKHVSTACEKCHVGGVYAGTPTRCVDCHGDDDAHSGTFGWECADCHATEKWGGAALDHNATGFPLTGRHKDTSCEKCHVGGVYAGTPTRCVDCHGDDDAHSGTFGWECADCHTTEKWRGATFDHSGQTDCQSCHGDDQPSNHYSGQCSACHSTNSWGNVSFSHSFPLNHGGAKSECAACHPDSLSVYTCYECHKHEPQKMQEKHEEKDIFDLSNCAACHPNGKKD